MILPAFKRSPSCPKCGSDNIDLSYTESTKPSDEDARQTTKCGWSFEEHFEEHIHLVCGRCDYGKQKPWIMAIAESPRTIGFVKREDQWQTPA